jgi:hypothetical protein
MTRGVRRFSALRWCFSSTWWGEETIEIGGHKVALATRRVGPLARIALGAIRLVNGSVALFAPDVLGARLGVQTASSPGLGYGTATD